VYAAPAWAQHDHDKAHDTDQTPSEIPSLSAQELAGLRNGDGMGMAKPAELNHYPGPKHVLELADDLELSPEQRERMTEIRAAMLEEAVRLGAQIIETEGTLNRRFAHEHIDEAALKDMTAQIASLYGELRYAHLAAHLAAKAALTAEQIEAYDRLRGYSADP
jgi:Spy/CpxP family protein refolding chaperone